MENHISLLMERQKSGDGTYKWEEFINGVVVEKYRVLEDFFGNLER